MSEGALQGRVGNLTPDQEAKLRELWSATLGILGVTSDGLAATDGDETTESASENVSSLAESDQNSTVDSVGSDKRKKKHLGIFGRKRGTGDRINDDSRNSNGNTVSEADDKYGQNKAFKNAVASETPEDLHEAFWGVVKHDHPDGLLLRFLRARKWDVEKALVMMVSTLHWRLREMHVEDEIVKRGEGGALQDSKSSDSATRKEGDDFLAQLRMGKSFLHGVDNEGRPIAVVRVRYHKQGEQSESSTEKFTVYVIETARLFLAPPVDTAAVIFDMTGFSMANMDYAPVKFMIKCFEANYPESLGVVLVHKAPWIFQGIWSIIRGWLDPVVAGKVHFTRNVEDLEEFIPRSRIIKELGGDEDWTYQYVEPNPNENDQMRDEPAKQKLLAERAKSIKRFEMATLSWISSAAERKNLASVRSQRNDLAEQLRTGYWLLDPYLRARTIYDRTGCIKGAGRIDFYPGETSGRKDTGDESRASFHQTSEEDLD
ncbi:MAG: hypothetical protein M1819_006940 [Sarea resinae]|nr:MAG: hypothetical protein M1819_006940 [Sarea resinae]